MKILMVLDRKWSGALFPKVIKALKTIGFEIPVYLMHYGPQDFELALCKEYCITGYRQFPLRYEDIEAIREHPPDDY